jgi:hypothetical protein
MNRFPSIAPFALLTLAALTFTAGCKSNQNAASNGQTAADANQAAPPDSASDPASANLAPVSATTSTAPGTASDAQQSAPPAADSGAGNDQASGQTTNDASYGQQPVETAPQPPPALPDYDQPPSPGDGDLWTPGYWNYASAGYYWVPGVWVQAPYQGALWTPGYWGWTGGRYGFFRGYWGPHIGFYGGVNYGFGYVGTGYQGGYWNGNNFFYNRAVNNINVTVIHNVYNRTVIVNNTVRISYNGPGGVQVRPRPAELAALREPHAPPMRAQVQIEHAASVDKASFVTVNHGRPANPVIAKVVVADRDVHPVAPPAARNMAPAPRNAMEARPNAAPPARVNEPARSNEPNRAAPGHPAPARPEVKPNAPARNTEPSRPAQQKPAPAARPETVAPHPATHPQPKPEEHAAPGKPKPEAHPAQKPAPEKKPEEKRPEQ